MKQSVAISSKATSPWRTIRSGLVERDGRMMSYSESLQSPCSSCTTVACCTHLPLHTFQVANLGNLSFAQYLLNFEHLRLGLNSSGEWSTYYVYPCSLLNQSTLKCTVHATPEQPQICSHYNPYQCWYRSALTQASTDSFMLIDRSRLERLTTMLVFDEFRNIVHFPSWQELVAALSGLSDDDSPAYDAPIPDLPYDAWAASLASEEGPPLVRSARAATGEGAEMWQSAAELNNPCSGCSAPCCDTIVFPQSLPTAASTMDFYRFCLGYPGVELTVTEQSWALAVKTRCRHFRDGRCAIYGQPDRPLFCTFYDEWKCTFASEYGVSRPAGTVRLRLDDFAALASSVTVGDNGVIVGLAPVDDLRARVEEGRRARAGLTGSVTPPGRCATMGSPHDASPPRVIAE